MNYRLIQDYPGKPPTPAERVAIARALFVQRYGREPAVVLVAPEQATDGAEASALIRPGLAWAGPVEGGAE